MAKIILPGLIDPHVHLREPGQTHKEDFYTGTVAALTGGYTTIIDMANNKTPITTFERLNEKIAIAKKKIVCDVGFYFGSLGDNLNKFTKVKQYVLGLKLYLNETTGNFLINKKLLKKIFIAWSKSSSAPILLHAEDDAVDYVIKIVERTGQKAHFCHISTRSDLKQIIKAKEEGLPISCGVTPHHLFLNEHDAKRLGPFGKMKPPLRSKKDVEFLWKHINAIDVVESDHAPHTREEKEGRVTRAGEPHAGAPALLGVWETRGAGERQDPPAIPFGVPGLETTLPLLLTAVSEKRLTFDDIIRLCHKNPSKIFRIRADPRTKIEIDTNRPWTIKNKNLFTKVKWSPFNNWGAKGKVSKVFIRGRKVFENGKILAKPGFGKTILSS